MQLGDHISFEKDGIVHTERVESVHYSSGSPAIYQRLNRWESFLRRLTPPRWRRSLLIREAEPPAITINDDRNPVGKTLAQLEAMKTGLGRILDDRMASPDEGSA